MKTWLLLLVGLSTNCFSFPALFRFDSPPSPPKEALINAAMRSFAG
jgi:hypothetical protein